MARTVIPPTVVASSFFPTLPVGAGSLTITPTPGDTGNGNYAVIVNSKTLVLAFNTDSGAHTVTVTSVAAAGDNRTGDITTYSIAAGGVAKLGAFTTNGWASNSPVANSLQIDVSDPKVVLVNLTLP